MQRTKGLILYVLNVTQTINKEDLMYAVLNKIKIKSKILPYILKKNADINIKNSPSMHHFILLLLSNAN